jgi:uncharacterized protein (TIGR02466 family)
VRWNTRADGRSRAFVELARRAIALRPDDPGNWELLARALTRAGAHDDAVSVLAEATTSLPDVPQLHLLHATACCRIGRLDLAREVLARVPAFASNDRTLALSRLRILMEITPGPDAVGFAREALALDPACGEALEILGRDGLRSDSPDVLLPLCRAALAQAPGHARARYELARACARVGHMEEARQLIDLDRFVSVTDLPPPEGYGDAAEFAAALVREIIAHPTLKPDPAGQATRGGFQTAIDLAHTADRTLAALLDQIRAGVDAFAAALPQGSADPFVQARPGEAALEAWAVVCPAAGHQTTHIHPTGWLSGVYYVSVPEAASDDPRGGCLLLGSLGEDDSGGEPPWGTHVHRPLPGQMILFPSYIPHATAPLQAAGLRICVAFDVVPLEAAEDARAGAGPQSP